MPTLRLNIGKSRDKMKIGFRTSGNCGQNLTNQELTDIIDENKHISVYINLNMKNRKHIPKDIKQFISDKTGVELTDLVKKVMVINELNR